MATKVKTADVIPFRQREPISVPLAKLDGYEGVKLMGRILRSWERESKFNTFKSLAKKANLCSPTVARIASGDTKSPRLHTILAILSAIGYSAVRFD